MREIVNAILCQSRTGCQWDDLPHDLPPRSAACYYFARWRDDGTDQAIHDLLRWCPIQKSASSQWSEDAAMMRVPCP
jgi:transposase